MSFDASILETILKESEELSLHGGVSRRLNLRVYPRKATVCIGVRRSGKSTYMHQKILKLIASGIPRENILWLHFSDERLYGLKGNELGLVLTAFYKMHPDIKGRVYCFFDEIQLIEGWELFVDRLIRHNEYEVYITGSSAKMLSKEIASEMRGRSLSWEVFPFSFKEFLDFREIPIENALTTKDTARIKNVFDEYWIKGGFPEVLDFDSKGIIETHQTYFKSVLFRDLIERHAVSQTKLLMDLAHWLIAHVGSLYSVKKLIGYLQSLGHKAFHTSVADLIDWLEDAYFFFSVPIFDASVARTNRNPKKIYCIDHALVRSVASSILVNKGHLLENLVFIALRRLGAEIYYYKTLKDGEVDFIALMPDKNRWLVQVCETVRDPETKNREVRALTHAMEELQLTEATIVTRDEDETIQIEAGTIRVIPTWRFLMTMPDWVEV